MLQDFSTYLTPSYAVAVIWLSLLLFLDKSTTHYRRFWCVTLATAMVAVLGATWFLASLPSYDEIKSGAAVGTALESRRPVIALVLLGFPAFPVAFLTGCFAPALFNRPTRLLARTTVIALVLIASASIFGVVKRFDHDRSVARAANARAALGVKEGQTIGQRMDEMEAWHKETEPDQTVGPQTYGEWQYVGAQAKFEPNEPGGVLVELLIHAKPSKPDPYQWLLKATTVRSLYVSFGLSPERLKTIASMPWLRVLHLTNVDLDDEGLKQLLTLKELEELSIHGSRVTAAGLRTFLEFESLKSFSLQKSSVTYAELQAFVKQTSGKWLFTGSSFVLKAPTPAND